MNTCIKKKKVNYQNSILYVPTNLLILDNPFMKINNLNVFFTFNLAI